MGKAHGGVQIGKADTKEYIWEEYTQRNIYREIHLMRKNMGRAYIEEEIWKSTSLKVL